MAREISVTACPFPEDWRRKTWLWSGRRACAVWLWTWLWGMCSRRRQVPWTLKKLSGNHDFRFGITFEKKKNGTCEQRCVNMLKFETTVM